MRTGRYDGVDSPSNSTNSSNSSSNSSPSVADQPRHHHQDTAIHHSLRQNLGPYFANGYMPAIGGSPAESPLSQPPINPPTSGTPKDKAASPGSMAGFFPLAGTGTSSIRPPADLAPFHAQFAQDRFPFASDTYTATAIRG